MKRNFWLALLLLLCLELEAQETQGQEDQKKNDASPVLGNTPWDSADSQSFWGISLFQEDKPSFLTPKTEDWRILGLYYKEEASKKSSKSLKENTDTKTEKKKDLKAVLWGKVFQKNHWTFWTCEIDLASKEKESKESKKGAAPKKEKPFQWKPVLDKATYDDLLDVQVTPEAVLLIYATSLGTAVELRDTNKRSWAWDKTITLTEGFIGPQGHLGIVGVKDDNTPYLWVDGQEITAPANWRGRMSCGAFSPQGDYLALGRGALDEDNPVKLLTYSPINDWKELPFSKAGDFPLKIFWTAEEKNKPDFLVLGTGTQRPEGKKTPWILAQDNLTEWTKADEEFLTFGSYSTKEKFSVFGLWQKDSVKTWYSWDGIKEKALEGYPSDSFPYLVFEKSEESK